MPRILDEGSGDGFTGTVTLIKVERKEYEETGDSWPDGRAKFFPWRDELTWRIDSAAADDAIWHTRVSLKDNSSTADPDNHTLKVDDDGSAFVSSRTDGFKFIGSLEVLGISQDAGAVFGQGVQYAEFDELIGLQIDLETTETQAARGKRAARSTELATAFHGWDNEVRGMAGLKPIEATF